MNLLLLISVTWQLASGISACRHKDHVYFPKGATVTKTNYNLKGHVIQTRFSESQIACSHFCLKNSRCQSINYKPPSGKDRGLCEINDRGLSNELRDQQTNKEKGFVFSQFTRDKGDGSSCIDKEQSSEDLCKGGWTEYSSYCYKVVDDLATFYQAKSSCIREGARLASIEDLGELRFLKAFLERVFLGMTDITEEERLVWMKWSNYILGSLWHGYDPSDGVRENCLVYVQEQGFQFKKCYESTRYVCKYSLRDM